MRAWVAILTEKHPQYTWIAAEQTPIADELNNSQSLIGIGANAV